MSSRLTAAPPRFSRAEWAKHLVVGSPLERPVAQLRRAPNVYRRWRAPELNEIWSEPGFVHQALRRLLRSESNAIDVGAHLGSFTSTLLRLAPRGRHVAVEALPHKANWLRRKFPDVDVLEIAVTDKPGPITFHHNVGRSGFSGIDRHAWPGDRTVQIEVAGGRLDDVVPADRPIELLKIDVEGAELPALRGAVRLLDRWRPPVLFECTLETTTDADRRALHDLFTSAGYTVWTAGDWLHGRDPLVADAFEEATHYPFRAFNFFAIPSGGVNRD